MNEERKTKVDGKRSEEDMFCVTVLARAKEIFGADADKIDTNKMIMLCCFVADDVKYPLTKGWFK